VQDDTSEIDIDIAPNVRVSVVRSTIASVMTPKIANDAKPG
jgi:preprotein translocase subunit YajC